MMWSRIRAYMAPQFCPLNI